MQSIYHNPCVNFAFLSCIYRQETLENTHTLPFSSSIQGKLKPEPKTGDNTTDKKKTGELV